MDSGTMIAQLLLIFIFSVNLRANSSEPGDLSDINPDKSPVMRVYDARLAAMAKRHEAFSGPDFSQICEGKRMTARCMDGYLGRLSAGPISWTEATLIQGEIVTATMALAFDPSTTKSMQGCLRATALGQWTLVLLEARLKPGLELPPLRKNASKQDRLDWKRIQTFESEQIPNYRRQLKERTLKQLKDAVSTYQKNKESDCLPALKDVTARIERLKLK